MELLESINKEGQPFLVYIDAEFQTYRVPSQRDPLELMKYTKTPYDFGMSEGNFGNNKYHFLLNIGFIIIGPYGRSSHFAMFPTHFSSGVFENPQLLEPGYTTCSPYADYEITEKRKIIGEKGTFPYYADFHGDAKKQSAFREINAIYNSSITPDVMMESYATLAFLLHDIAPRAMVVHKGRNDLYALANTVRLLFDLDMPKILTRDLDRVKLRLPGLTKTKLELVQTYFTMPPALPNNVSSVNPVHLRLHEIKHELILIRKTLLEEIRAFFIEKWGAGAGDVAAHNPLVDCVYTAIMDLGLGSSADGAISLFGTDSDGVSKFFS